MPSLKTLFFTNGKQRPADYEEGLFSSTYKNYKMKSAFKIYA